jgi:Tol biopolymer transport system component
MVNQGPSADLWVYDSARGTKTRLTNGKSVYSYPVWTPDGQFVVFSGPGGVFWTRADAAGQPQALTPCQGLCFPTSFTSDGSRLVFSELKSGGGAIQTVSVNVVGDQLRAGPVEPFLQTPSALPFPAFSPDGRWIAYADGTSGTYEGYVRAFPDRGNRWLISSGGGSMPRWSKNGSDLFYRTEDSRIMVASYTSDGDTFRPDKPRLWSKAKLANTGLTPNFDLAPDGKRAVVLTSAERHGSADDNGHAILVMNPFAESRRTAATPDH